MLEVYNLKLQVTFNSEYHCDKKNKDKNNT